jgi:hypothetical protein
LMWFIPIYFYCLEAERRGLFSPWWR